MFGLFGNKTKKEKANDQDTGSPFLVSLATKKDRRNPELAAGTTTNESKTTHEAAYKSSELIHSCVSFIANTAGQARLNFFVVDDKGNKTPIHKSIKELSNLAYEPNPFMTWGGFLGLGIKAQLLSGNTYISYEKQAGKGELWCLTPSSSMEVVPHKTNYIEGYIYNNAIPYKPEEICHWKDHSVTSEFYGVGVVSSLVDTVALESYTIDDLKLIYENGGLGIGALQSKFPLTEPQADSLRKTFKSLMSRQGDGRFNAIVLPNGLEYKSISMNPVEAAFLDSLKISEHRILQSFHLNPIVLGGRLESYTSDVKQVQSSVFNSAVRPLLVQFVDEIEHYFRKKFKNPNIVVEIDLSRLPELDEAVNIKASAAKTLYTTGLASLNEARHTIGLPKLDNPEADIYYIPAYLVGSDPQIIGGEDKINQSTDPDGGVADAPAPTAENNSNNGGNE